MLRCIEPKALLGQYSGIFLKPIRPQNKRNLEKAVQGALLLQDFDPMQVDLLGPYDKGLTTNRTWWFRFNQLPTLGWASGIWDDTNHGHEYIDFNFEVIRNWAAHSADELPLKWHDHASAFRMKNMADWYITIANHSTSHCEPLERLADLIDEHLQWLCEDKNYSRRTNHGFEQARFMMSVASEMPGLPTSAQALEEALLRLQDEICFAFTGQGVHKENSPGYQWFMIKVMQEAKAMLDGYDLELPDIDFRKMLARARRFLDAIALPDNSLPLIGDTQYKEKQNSYVSQLRKNKPKEKGVQLYDYSKSGYVIVKDFTDQESPIHLVLKNGHLSDYHRHNDDLSIHLTKGNTVIFGDGGLFSHNHSDIGRRYAKSAWAHSTFFPTELAEKRIKRKQLIKSPELSVCASTINSETWFYAPDFALKRSLTWRQESGLRQIEIIDSITSKEYDVSIPVSTSFLIPVGLDDIQHDKKKRTMNVDFKSFFLKLVYLFDCRSISFVEEIDCTKAAVSDLAFVSERMGGCTPATRIDFVSDSNIYERKIHVVVNDKKIA